MDLIHHIQHSPLSNNSKEREREITIPSADLLNMNLIIKSTKHTDLRKSRLVEKIEDKRHINITTPFLQISQK